MGVHQSTAVAQHGQGGFDLEPPDDTWTVCEATGDLLTQESWTLVDGNLTACFDVNSDFMIIPAADELVTWIGKLRRARHYCVFREAPAHIKNSREAVYAAVCGDANVLDFAPEIYQRDRDIVMAAVKRECTYFENIVEEFRADRDIVLLAVRRNGKLLQHAAEALHKDRQLVSEAVKTDSSALLLYPQECWDADLVLSAISGISKPECPAWGAEARPRARHEHAFRSFMNHEKVKQVFDQRHFVMAALEKDPLILRFASSNLKADKELVLRAVKSCWKALEYASEELRSDLDVVATALAQTQSALQFAAESIKDNYDLVLEAVKTDPQALGFASKRLRADDVISATAYRTFIAAKCNRVV